MGAIKQFALYVWNKFPPSAKLALHGLMVAVEGSVLMFLAEWASQPQAFTFTKASIHSVIVGVAGAALIAIRNWIRQSASTSLQQYKDTQTPQN